MKYAIEILVKKISEHRERIQQLQSAEYEMHSSLVFADEQVAEQVEYINQLQQAIMFLVNGKKKI